MNPVNTDDWLEHALAADGVEHRAVYLADDGFTAHVAAALPLPLASPAWRTPIIVLLWAVAAVGLYFVLPGLAIEAIRDVLRFVAAHPVSLSELGVGLGALGLAAWGATAVVLRTSG